MQGQHSPTAVPLRRSPLHILLVTQWFPPEQAPVGHMMLELARSLVQHGHQVTVITGFPNHPEGRVFGGYSKRLILKEEIDSIQVWRVWLATSPKRTKLNRMLTFLSFTVSSSLVFLFAAKCDIVFAVLQPLSVGPFLSAVCRIKRAKLVFNVQDLHPDVPIDLGLIRNQLMIWFLRRIERFTYRHCNAVTTICEGFRNHIRSKRSAADSVYVIPNWIDTEAVRPQCRLTPFRKELGLNEEHIVCLFAGTVGHVSGADVLLDAAERLRTIKHIRFLFVGEGPIVPQLKESVARRGLSNVLFRGFQPRERLSEVQSTSDISLVTLKHGKGTHSVPSKVLGYMAAGRPIVASVHEDSETARQIRSADCGLVVPSEEAAALADAIKSLADNKATCDRLGRNGRTFVEHELAMDRVLERYVQTLEDIAADGTNSCRGPLSNTP